MHRRLVLASVASLSTAGLVGCLGIPDGAEQSPSDLPEDCPVDTLDAHDTPEELDRESVEAFVESYEEAYIEETAIDHEQHERVEGPGSSVKEVEPGEDGYRVEVATGWATWDPDREVLVFEPVDDGDVADVDPVPFEHEAFDGIDVLQVAVETAAGDDESTGDRDEYRLGDGHPDYGATETVIDLAAGRVEGAVIEHDDALVRVTRDTAPGVHGDGWKTAAYYVEAGAVYRTEDRDGDPRDGTLLEC